MVSTGSSRRLKTVKTENVLAVFERRQPKPEPLPVLGQASMELIGMLFPIFAKVETREESLVQYRIRREGE